MMIFVMLSGVSVGMLYPIAEKVLVIHENPQHYPQPVFQQLWEMGKNSIQQLGQEGWDGFSYYLKTNFFDFMDRNHPLDVLKAVILVSILLFFIKSAVDYLYRIIFADVEQNVIRYYQQEIFNHFSKMSLKFFQKYRIGELTSRITNDVNLIGWKALGSFIEIIKDVLLVLFYLFIAIVINWQLTIIAFTFI